MSPCAAFVVGQLRLHISYYLFCSCKFAKQQWNWLGTMFGCVIDILRLRVFSLFVITYGVRKF